MMPILIDPVNQQNNSFGKIANALRQLSVDQLAHHKLLALATSRGLLQTHENGKQRLFVSIHRQAVCQGLLEELGKKISDRGIQVGLLKGAALWGDIYRPGEREASDLDLFVSAEQFASLKAALYEMYFQPTVEKQSRASEFKTLFISDSFPDLSIEVHLKLWWLEPKGFNWHWRPAERSPYLRLSLEDQLIHLCGHWIAQHTMISLHWLFDIVLFLDKYETQIDEATLQMRAKLLQLARSVEIAREITARITSEKGFSALDDYRINREFLTAPKSNLLRYFWIKHAVQDTFVSALAYDLQWSAEWIRSSFSL
jgi:hypothetical protein